jgi:hypothetical protein
MRCLGVWSAVRVGRGGGLVPRRGRQRQPLSGLLAAVIALIGMLALAGAAAAAEFGVTEENFEAGTCTVETCTYESSPSEFYTQSAGHPPFGVTTFSFNSEEPAPGVTLPVGKVKNVRVDLPPGLAANPQAISRCPVATFEKDECPGPEAGEENNTLIGINYLTIFTGTEVATIPAAVYDLVQPEGIPLEFGIHVYAPHIVNEHIFMVGHVSWSTDYHEYFEINNINEATPLLKSKLVFFGNAGTGFLTLPSECSTSTTSHLRVESWKGEVSETNTHTPVGVEKCSEVPFSPTLGLTPSSTQLDQPDDAAISVALKQSETGAELNSPDVKNAVVTMPEGMTLNPSAANGLVACSNGEFGMKTTNAVSCPAASQVGTVKIETPDLPEAMTGGVYAGQPVAGKGPESGEEYRLFVDAESKYGVSVRLEGKVKANTSTGRLETTFTENPQLPFTKFTLSFSGPHAPIANPLTCGKAIATSVFTPYTGTAAAGPLAEFTVDVDGKGGACPSPMPFALTQSTEGLPTTGASTTSFKLKLGRTDGNQYLQKVSTTLPAGLVAKIPSVPLCAEPAAKAGACPEASKIGTVSTSVGSGPTPYPLSGSVYLTGPYGGAPFGLSIVVPATKVGPYDYGNILTRAAISINPYTARVTIAGNVPTIVGGVPLRMKGLTIAVEHANFMLNPTNCGTLATETTFTSTMGATDLVSTPFQATGCSSLAFKPKFSYSTNGNPTKRYGARLDVKLRETAGNANIKSVKVQLPLKLPSRQSTLALACAEKTFAAAPYTCPSGSNVGGVTITTPTLPGTLSGPAYFVSHGGAAFPDLDLVAKGDGVTVILVGKTNISKGITHTTFESLPDVPVSSFELNLPTGEKSALGVNGNFCHGKMYMPTTVVGQNGKSVTEKIQIHVAECPVRIVRHKVRGDAARITAAVSSAGKLSTSGKDLLVVHKKIGKAVGNAKIGVKLSRLGKRILASKHRLTVRVRVGFKSSTGAKRESKAFVKLVFRS